MAKRKNHKSSGLKVFLFFLLVLIVTTYFYKREYFSEVKNYVKSYAENLIEEAASFSSDEKIASDSGKKYILLPKGLELPLCPAKEHAEDHEIRNFTNYSICYRETYEQAEWSAYSLSYQQLEKKATRSNDFRPDPAISTGSASLSDYKASGYDRGHLTPAADMSFSELAMSESFYMSNMSPQAPQFNRGIWKDLETQVRLWAEKFGKLYVVSGPVLDKTASDYKTIGENKVAVPEAYYKVILVPLYEDEADKSTSDDAASITAIGFIIPNQKCEDDFWSYAVSVDKVESVTGLDFYSLLPDSVENEVEGLFELEMWK
ncbi:DNA/RNA endonuclease G, NUC1 [Treponema sp. JC4]|uniref:DNA/RNA non-specific endonuclease n=1 Tax=Treponema sp. JC4 TaxID=1124982 RepID=UPI00025AFD7A|nr:DNA/RNA non-specific endonuclease [Treponema sp. JC4]EID84835.1 DNA/RNA endonuclease G, NUC1 [Treponema sp. JC4]